MKIYIGADHNGFNLKNHLVDYLKLSGHEVVDEGDELLSTDDDFPVYAARVASAVLASNDPEPRGILICGSGQGMAMAANRFKGIRASLVWDLSEAHSSRNDDDSNVLCLPAGLRVENVNSIVTAWLTTPFAAAPRFKRRIKEMDELN